MSRPIKFRVWSKRNNSFECSVNDWSEQAIEIYVPIQELLKSSIKRIEEDDDFVIQQFTGLLDSAGKEIYEGDIVEYSSSDPKFSKTVVRWTRKDEDNYPGFVVSSSYNQYGLPTIIGNIFENGDLVG